MNKKILGSFALASVVVVAAMPLIAFAGGSSMTLSGMGCAVQDAAENIGIPIVVIGWIIAGILYLTSSGAPERMGIAKKAIIAATIGTVLIVLAVGSSDILSVIGDAFGITPPSNSCPGSSGSGLIYHVSNIAMTFGKIFIA